MSTVGLSVGSGIKLEIIAKKITPAKNCKEEIDHQSLNKLTFIKKWKIRSFIEIITQMFPFKNPMELMAL